MGGSRSGGWLARGDEPEGAAVGVIWLIIIAAFLFFGWKWVKFFRRLWELRTKD